MAAHVIDSDKWEPKHYDNLLKALAEVSSRNNNFLRSLLGTDETIAYLDAEIAQDVNMELDELTEEQTGEERLQTWQPVAHCRLCAYYEARMGEQSIRHAYLRFQEKRKLADIREKLDLMRSDLNEAVLKLRRDYYPNLAVGYVEAALSELAAVAKLVQDES